MSYSHSFVFRSCFLQVVRNISLLGKICLSWRRDGQKASLIEYLLGMQAGGLAPKALFSVLSHAMSSAGFEKMQAEGLTMKAPASSGVVNLRTH
jgi:hypothetical protein